uniref:Uncharacterized protein n=1 Tax=Glossina brevipalpis TaxID=37001 RepID=A0A1A9WM83_9MUSC
MLGERSLLLSGYNAIESAKKPCDNSNSPSPAVTQAAITLTPTSTAAAAAAYLYLEKVKNERMSPRMTAAQIDSLKDAIIESSAAVAAAAAIANNNNNNNHNNNCFLKNKNTGNINDNISINNSCTNNNSLVITHQQTQIGNIEHNSISKTNVNNNNSTSDELQNHSHNPQPLGHLSTHIGTNHVKKERLSPGTNGDLHSSLSRSRSTTPSSFRETSPQQSIHSSPSETMIPIHNLSSNILNTIQQAAATTGRQNAGPTTSGINSSSVSTLPADFSAHNYSDFMRSLAAKYNNTNPNDSSNSRRSAFFEMIPNSIAITNTTTTTTTTKKPLAAHKVSFSSASCNTATSKEMSITPTLPPPPPLASSAISPCEATTLKQPQQSQQIAAAAAAAAAAASNTNVSPFMTSFLSTLPFAQGVFPPLIDMSSTQALITLARAAKDTEIQNVLRSAQIPKRLSANTSPSPRPSLSVALQQAAQFVSPALMYSAQLQHQQQLAASQQSSPAHSRPIMDPHSNVATKPVPASAGHCSISDKIEVNATPLDLSSQPPPSKRLKAESISSQSSSIDGLLAHTVQRRVSSSTVATTPSPPPYIAKSVISIVGSDTTTTNENTATTPAYTNYKTVNSTPLIVGPTTSLMTGGIRQCQAQSEEVNSWSVEDVCIFVGSIDICAEYVKII